MVRIVLIVLALAVGADRANAHCQIPCGIYDDAARFTLMREHVTTIEKSMTSISKLAASGDDANQLARWVANKEAHADELTDIVTYYFLAQRVQPIDSSDKDAWADYTGKLTALHGIMVHAMKAKQTTDLDHVASLRSLIDRFETLYAHEH